MDLIKIVLAKDADTTYLNQQIESINGAFNACEVSSDNKDERHFLVPVSSYYKKADDLVEAIKLFGYLHQYKSVSVEHF